MPRSLSTKPRQTSHRPLLCVTICWPCSNLLLGSSGFGNQTPPICMIDSKKLSEMTADCMYVYIYNIVYFIDYKNATGRILPSAHGHAFSFTRPLVQMAVRVELAFMPRSQHCLYFLDEQWIFCQLSFKVFQALKIRRALVPGI